MHLHPPGKNTTRAKKRKKLRKGEAVSPRRNENIPKGRELVHGRKWCLLL